MKIKIKMIVDLFVFGYLISHNIIDSVGVYIKFSFGWMQPKIKKKVLTDNTIRFPGQLISFNIANNYSSYIFPDTAQKTSRWPGKKQIIF